MASGNRQAPGRSRPEDSPAPGCRRQSTCNAAVLPDLASAARARLALPAQRYADQRRALVTRHHLEKRRRVLSWPVTRLEKSSSAIGVDVLQHIGYSGRTRSDSIMVGGRLARIAGGLGWTPAADTIDDHSRPDVTRVLLHVGRFPIVSAPVSIPETVRSPERASTRTTAN